MTVERSASLVVVVLAALATGACYSYRAGRAPSPERDARVRFDAPTALNVSVSGQDTVRLANVTRVDGRVLAVRRDTLLLAVWSVRADPNAPAIVSGGLVQVALGPGRTVEVRDRDEGRTFLSVLLGSAALVVLFAVLSYLAEPGYGQ